MKKLLLIPSGILFLIFGCHQGPPSDISPEDIAFAKAVPLKMCEKMSICTEEWSADLPEAGKELAKSMFSQKNCMILRRGFISRALRNPDDLTPRKIRYSRDCLSSFMNANCDQLKDDGPEKLPGCKELKLLSQQ